MDLSAVIFVVLALAWAAYLIPKALKHHDEMASDRLVQGHSDKVRILSRKARAAASEVAEAIVPAKTASADEPQDPTPAPLVHPVDGSNEIDEVAVHSIPVVDPRLARPTRAAARQAAARRRRVLAVLVASLVVVWGLAWAAYLPFFAPAVPAALVVGWLVLARLSVRKQQSRPRQERRVVSAGPDDGTPVDSVTTVASGSTEATAESSTAEEFLDRLADEETGGIAREEIEEALASDGSLWDPLPMTLPTYVNKARARRTVRTIELTGISSSGHDETDSTLAREAADAAREEADRDVESETRRKAAGA